MRRQRHLLMVLTLAVTASLPVAADAGAATGLVDVNDSDIFAEPIAWLRAEGITRGCNPPDNNEYCPQAPVSRGQMAAFLTRSLRLDVAALDSFIDDTGSVFEEDINQLAAAGVTRGCNPPSNDRFCPTDPVTRSQMAAFLARAFELPASATDRFIDDEGSLFEDDINRLAAAGITFGCNPPDNDRFCPQQAVTRAQMAAFLWRAHGSPPATIRRLVAAGDIAECDLHHDEATAALIDQLLTGTDGTVAALGDTVYPDGTAEQYASCYEPSWGRHRHRTRPAVGNHEYRTPGASGYFEYFGSAAGDPGQGWYSYELGSWQIIVLNSNCGEVDCETGSKQERWLRSRLSAEPRLCTLAYMHHPRFSSGMHGDADELTDLWQALEDHRVDVALAGHDHNYERLGPLTATGNEDPTGIASFVVGTGGTYLRSVAEQRLASQVVFDGAHGVLVLDLSPSGYAWQFVDTAGTTLDSGSALCS